MEVLKSYKYATCFVSNPYLVLPLKTLSITTERSPENMSTLFQWREDTEDPDLRIYTRRISLRAPPLPNLVSVTLPLRDRSLHS